MSNGQNFIWIMMIVALAAYFIDHLGRLNAIEKNKMTAEERANSYRTPTNYEPFSAMFDAFGKMTELIYAPIGMALTAIGTVTEFVYKPISMGLDAIGKVSEFIWKPLTIPLAIIGSIGSKKF
jgi:hypothetical protein